MDKRILNGVTVPGHGCVDIRIEEGFITDIHKSCSDMETYAIPGFIDTHIHGFGGCGSEDGKKESILSMSRDLIRYGITSFFPTLYTDTKERMEASLTAIREAKGKEEGADIAGIHIEGPFISPKRIGAQNPDGRKDPDEALFLEFLSLAPGLVKAMTIAPELKGSEKIAKVAKENNVVLLAGHTDATFDEVKRGRDAGIRHATHLFNAMKGLHHREPGTVGAILALEDMTFEIIADGYHVHPEVLKVALKAKGPYGVVVITDSLAPTGQKSGPTFANGVPVVLKDGLWVTKGREDLIQGSSLNMHKAFKNLLSWGINLYDAVLFTSTNAARIYNLKDRGAIDVGKRADILLLDKNYDIKEVIKCGMTL